MLCCPGRTSPCPSRSPSLLLCRLALSTRLVAGGSGCARGLAGARRSGCSGCGEAVADSCGYGCGCARGNEEIGIESRRIGSGGRDICGALSETSWAMTDKGTVADY